MADGLPELLPNKREGLISVEGLEGTVENHNITAQGPGLIDVLPQRNVSMGHFLLGTDQNPPLEMLEYARGEMVNDVPPHPCKFIDGRKRTQSLRIHLLFCQLPDGIHWDPYPNIVEANSLYLFFLIDIPEIEEVGGEKGLMDTPKI